MRRHLHAVETGALARVNTREEIGAWIAARLAVLTELLAEVPEDSSVTFAREGRQLNLEDLEGRAA